MSCRVSKSKQNWSLKTFISNDIEDPNYTNALIFLQVQHTGQGLSTFRVKRNHFSGTVLRMWYMGAPLGKEQWMGSLRCSAHGVKPQNPIHVVHMGWVTPQYPSLLFFFGSKMFWAEEMLPMFKFFYQEWISKRPDHMYDFSLGTV